MDLQKKRKEIVLNEETLSILEEKTKAQGRNLKNYMGFVLREKTNYTSWKEIKKELF